MQEALSLISPWRGPNGVLFLVVSAPTVSLRGLEPGYGTGRKSVAPPHVEEWKYSGNFH